MNVNACFLRFSGWDESDEEENEGGDMLEQGKARWKRQSEAYELSPSKTRCPLLLVADYRFFTEMGAGNTKTTINYLVYPYLFVSVIMYVIMAVSKYANLIHVF